MVSIHIIMRNNFFDLGHFKYQKVGPTIKLTSVLNKHDQENALTRTHQIQHTVKFNMQKSMSNLKLQFRHQIYIIIITDIHNWTWLKNRKTNTDLNRSCTNMCPTQFLITEAMTQTAKLQAESLQFVVSRLLLRVLGLHWPASEQQILRHNIQASHKNVCQINSLH